MSWIISLNGDDFLNKCFFIGEKYSFLYQFFDQLFFIIDSRYLYIFIFFCSLSFSFIFSKIKFEGSGEKYFSTFNQIHMLIIFFISLLSFIDVTFTFLSFLIGQRSPCCAITDSYSSDFMTSTKSNDEIFNNHIAYEYNMPSVFIGQSLQLMFFCLSLHFFSNKYIKLLIIVIILLYSIFPVFEGLCSFFQSFTSLFLSYIYHFIFIKIKFRYLYITNTFNIIISIVFFSLFHQQNDLIQFSDTYTHLIRCCNISLLVSYLLFRYQYLHKGFNSIQSCIDVIEEINQNTHSFVKQVDQGEYSYPKNIVSKHLTDSLIVLFVYILLDSVSISIFKSF